MLDRLRRTNAVIRSAKNRRWYRAGERARHFPIRMTFVGLLVILALAPAPITYSQDGVISREAEIKAAYLFNFCKYVQWPATTRLVADDGSSPFVLCIVGASNVTSPLRAIAEKKTLNGRRLAIVSINDISKLRTCQMLFVPANQDSELVSEVLERVAKSATLVVGESKGFAETRGMINFFLEGNRLRFEINKEAAERTGLRISAKLLRLGRIVRTSNIAINR